MAQAEQLATPDYRSPITASDIAYYDRLRVITDAHQFLVPLIWLAVAAFVFLSIRFVFKGFVTRARTLVALWADTKESELRSRGRNPL